MDWDAVDQLLIDRLVASDGALDAAAREAAVAPNQGKLLHILARAIGARAILEIGTLAGYSTLWLARALPAGGRVVTLEADPQAAAAATANLAGLPVEVIVGPALEALPRLQGPFDMVFIDADKQSSPAYLEHAVRLARPGALIVADNVVRGGAVLDEASDDPRVAGVRSFLDDLGAHPRLVATALQTVGVKGHDGFAIALVE